MKFTHRTFRLATAIVTGGAVLVLSLYFLRNFPEAAGSFTIKLVIAIGTALMSAIMTFTLVFDPVPTSSFLDIDRKGATSERLPERVTELERMLLVETAVRPPPSPPPAPDFTSYFSNLITVLQNKSAVADEKASILLDKGVAYSRFGIGFYVTSIIAWQALSWQRGWHPEFIYGIASCSLLFIFIEFLAAWFLKQYRAFVDTSTYLIKVKSLFDRYMLTYLAQGDARITAAPEAPAAAALFAMLAADLKWPESYLTRDADANITHEFMTSLTELAAAARRPKNP